MRGNKLKARPWYMGVTPLDDNGQERWAAVGGGTRASVLVGAQHLRQELRQPIECVIVYHTAGAWHSDDTQDAGASVGVLARFHEMWDVGPFDFFTLCESHRVKTLANLPFIPRLPL